MKDTGEWSFVAGDLFFGFDPGSPTYKDESCLVEMQFNPSTGVMTVTHIKNWRADEKAQPFQTIYRARLDDHVRSDLLDHFRVRGGLDGHSRAADE